MTDLRAIIGDVVNSWSRQRILSRAGVPEAELRRFEEKAVVLVGGDAPALLFESFGDFLKTYRDDPTSLFPRSRT